MKAVCFFLVVMAALILAALSLPAHAATLQLRNDALTITLHESSCPLPALVEVLNQVADGHKKLAAITFNGRHITACWVLDGMNVAVLDADMEGGFIPVGLFKSVD